MGAQDKSQEETFIKHQVSQRMREGKRKKEGRISSPNSCLLCLLSYFKGFSCLLSFPYFTTQKKKKCTGLAIVHRQLKWPLTHNLECCGEKEAEMYWDLYRIFYLSQ